MVNDQEYFISNGDGNDGIKRVKIRRNSMSQDFWNCGVNFLDAWSVSERMGNTLSESVYV